MAAYAAVTSLIDMLDNIQLYDAHRPIFVTEQQRQLASVRSKACALQIYLERNHNGDSELDEENLESRIADTSYEAEDIIESLMLDENHDMFDQRLEKVIKVMHSMEKEAILFRENSISTHQQPRFLALTSSSRPSPSSTSSVVGIRDDVHHVIDKLTGHQSKRLTISITGMGGIGKTTLAKYVFDSLIIQHHFDVCGWSSISQEYDERQTLLRLLGDMKAIIDEKQKSLGYEQIGVIVHKYLSQRRYLIVLDDVWSIRSWERMQLYFPDNGNRSRILLTSRLLDVANNFDSSNHIAMNLLNENESWRLLCKKVFNRECCPPELEEIGKRIARNCKGLPLTVVVAGGLLAKYNMRLQYWKDISEDISKIVKSKEDDRCLRILSLSYKHLPMYLKPCFVYMGVFPEDHQIRASKVIKLWVSEGFLKPISGKTLEEVAEVYLQELMDRNLIFADVLKNTGKVKFFKIHDLLREVCLAEASKCRFFGLIQDNSIDIPRHISCQRRVAIHAATDKFPGNSFPWISAPEKNLPALKSASFLRSCLCSWENKYNYEMIHLPGLAHFKLLRILHHVKEQYSLEDVLHLVNARYLNILADSSFYVLLALPHTDCSSINVDLPPNLFWNIQTLIVNGKRNYVVLPTIWEMPQVRHIIVETIRLPDPPSQVDEQDIIVLENLQTLAVVANLRCTEEFLKRMPNIKTLKLFIGYSHEDDDDQYDNVRFSLHFLKNIGHLHELKSLSIRFGFKVFSRFNSANFLQSIKFPLSLKKLTLQDCEIEWYDLGMLIGEIPQLEILKLHWCCYGKQWNPIEGQFNSLKILEIRYNGPVQWTADSFHFPCLEHLILFGVAELEEIPTGIGEIEALQSIHVKGGKHSLIASAKKILEEQQSFGNEEFRLVVNGEDLEKDEQEKACRSVIDSFL